jgi:hypothetical protein
VVKVQVSSTPTVSRHAFALFAFEPVTSTTQISSPNTALNATAEMQPSADISENLGTQLIFQLIDAYISNRDEMCSASQLAAKLLHHKSSCASRLEVHAQCLKSHEKNCVFQLVARAKCHNKSNEFAFRLIVGYIQKFRSRLQQDLVDLSLSNAFSIAKLDSINTAILCNIFASLVCEPVVSNKPFRSLRLDRIKSKMPFTFQLIVGSKQLYQRTPQQFLVDIWLSNSISNHGPNQHESSCASLLAVHAKCLKSHESSCASLLAVCAKCINSHESGCASLLAAYAKSRSEVQRLLLS